MNEDGSPPRQYKSLFWKAIGKLGLEWFQPTQHRAGAVKSVAVTLQIRGFGVIRSHVLLMSTAKKWRNIKNKKQICLCSSRLPGIKRLSFQHSTMGGLTQWRGAKAAGTSLCHPCFLTWYPLKKWVSSSVHHNALRSKSQGKRLLRC